MASGDTLLILTPLGAEWPAADAGTLAVRNGHPAVALDVTQESRWSAILPQHYGGGSITAIVHYAVAADAGAFEDNVWMAVGLERLNAGVDLDADGFAAEVQSAPIAVPDAAGEIATASLSLAGAALDGAAAGDLVRCRLARVEPGGALNPYVGGLLILAVELREA